MATNTINTYLYAGTEYRHIPIKEVGYYVNQEGKVITTNAWTKIQVEHGEWERLPYELTIYTVDKEDRPVAPYVNIKKRKFKTADLVAMVWDVECPTEVPSPITAEFNLSTQELREVFVHPKMKTAYKIEYAHRAWKAGSHEAFLMLALYLGKFVATWSRYYSREGRNGTRYSKTELATAVWSSLWNKKSLALPNNKDNVYYYSVMVKNMCVNYLESAYWRHDDRVVASFHESWHSIVDGNLCKNKKSGSKQSVTYANAELPENLTLYGELLAVAETELERALVEAVVKNVQLNWSRMAEELKPLGAKSDNHLRRLIRKLYKRANGAL